MGGWDPVRRRHRSWSLYSCLALLLLTQMGVASLLALHSRPGLDAQEGQAAFTTRSLAESPLDAAAAEVRRAAPEQTPAPAAAASSPADAPLLTGATYNTVGQPCHSTTFFVARVTQWAVPPGCFAKIYRPSPTSYPAMPGAFGQCSWWVEVLHAQNRDIIWNRTYPRGSTPIPGAVISFSPYVQGASGDGHYAQVVAVQPGSPWILVTEMNFTWRGGGFGKVDYRYVKVEPGMTFIYSGPWMLASQADRDNLD